MKTKILVAILTLAVLILESQLSTAIAQGSLAPPGAPAPTMKTLDQIEPRIPISFLPYTITNPGSYYLTANLIGTSGANGITVNSGNVTIDLNGFTLQGVPGSAAGIAVTTTFTNLVFRNGAVTGWGGNGIDGYTVGFPRNLLYEKLTVSGNGANGIHTEAGSIIRDCVAFNNGGFGFGSAGGEIIDCVSRNNSTDGFNANNCSLRHCSSEYNSNNGYTLSSSRALDCDSLYNSNLGFDCSGIGDEIHQCRAAYNGNDGVDCEATAGGTVIEDCEISKNTGYGIYTFSGAGGGAYIARNNFYLNTINGIGLNDNNNYVEGNHILTTGGDGIYTPSSTFNVVVRNVVAGGGAYNYFMGAGNDYGPVGVASSSTSPWANIAH